MSVLKDFDGYFIIGSDQTSDEISVSHGKRLAIQVVTTNTNAVGSLYIEASNNRTNWVPISFEDSNGDLQDSYSITSGNRMWHLFDMELTSPWARLRYASTSGSGGLTYYVNIKK